MTDDGLLRVFRASRQAGEIIRTYRVAEDDTWAAPALVDGALLIKDRRHLTLWQLPNRKRDQP